MCVITMTESPWLSLEIRKLPSIQEDVSVEGIWCPDIIRWRCWGWGGDQSGSEGCWRSQPKAETQVPILALNGVRSQHRPKQTQT